MKKTINALTIAAASCLLLGSTSQAATITERRIITSGGPEIIAEDVEVGMRGPVVSGTTLSGRREVRSNDARIFLDSDGRRATIQDERGTRNVRLRGLLPPGSVNSADLDDDDNELDEDDD